MMAAMLWGSAGAFVLMCVVWLAYKKTDNASWVDVAWAYGIGLCSIGFALLAPKATLTAWILAGMVSLWSLRLGSYLFVRVARGPEDGRYLAIRVKWHQGLDVKFFWFFQLQAGLVVLLSLPTLLVAYDAQESLAVVQWVGLALFVVAWAGESIADRQLAAFRKEPTSRGTTCRRGLWKYSRHPNYFFEILIWVSWAFYASSATWGFISWIAPALIAYFLIRVTGVPQTEAQALRTRGDDYRDYMARTSVLIPWFPRP